MRKFIALLKKEIKELLTPQMLIPLLIGVLVFIFIGNVAGSENKKAQGQQDIIVLDQDSTPSSKAVIDTLSSKGFKVTAFSNKSIDSVINEAKSKNISAVLSIPSGFEKGLEEFKPQQIETYSIVKKFTIMGSASAQTLDSAISEINDSASNQLIAKKVASPNPKDLKQPINTKPFVIVGNKMANTTMGTISGFVTSQTAFIPIIMFMVIIVASQMIAVSIASEKENKTLETLLSTPISRTSIVSAKMIAAGVVSLISAGFYMIGFKYYMNGLTGGALNQISSGQTGDVIKQLGLTLDTASYIMLGVSLFLSILIALAISLILGAFAEDVKKAQGLIAPMTFLIMIPYLVSMFVDLNTTSPIVKYFIYAIPFSHTFLASPNLFLHNYTPIIYGIVYQLIVFIVFLAIAAKIFSTDKILTMKLNFKRNSFKLFK